MLKPEKIKQAQIQLRPYHAQIFTSPKTNDAFILTRSMNLNQIIRIRLIAKDYRRVALTNQQFIHAQRFTDQDYNLNFNFRRNNGIDDRKRTQLSYDLLANFNVKMTRTGKLVIYIKHNLISAFLNLMNAILYLQNNGFRYLIRNNSVAQINHQLQHENRLIDHARQSYCQAKNHGQSPHKQHQSHHPKAHGRIVAGFSSTAGTPRELRYARERKAKQKQQAFLSKHPEIARQRQQQKTNRLKQQKFNLKNKKIVLAGRLTKPRSYYYDLMKKLNGKVQQRVNSQTDYLICNRPNHSQNYLAAKQRNIKTIKESQINK